jgi:hypothetical protein
MRQSHIMQLVLNPLYSEKIGCGTNASAYLFLNASCLKTLSQGNTGLVFSCESWYIFGVEQVD